jgi:hypothetical protein
MSTFEIAPDTAQRVAIVIEKNKAGTWSLDYADAAAALEKAWHRLSS